MPEFNVSANMGSFQSEDFVAIDDLLLYLETRRARFVLVVESENFAPVGYPDINEFERTTIELAGWLVEYFQCVIRKSVTNIKRGKLEVWLQIEPNVCNVESVKCLPRTNE